MRECGILLPVASLPSRYGIGAFSKEAYEWIDRLKQAGQGFWQVLPFGPTGYGDSPYQSFSAFAGNPYFIDLEQLIREGLLTKEECDKADFGDSRRYISYDRIYRERFPLLRKAYDRWKDGLARKGTAGKEFAENTCGVLEQVHGLACEMLGPETREYCFYMALKDHFQSNSWNLWDREIRLREPEALKAYGSLLTDEIGFYEFQQMKFEEQWTALKNYANKQGIRIIGDIPIYVAFDGADSWCHPELFQFDEENLPKAVAGCPPDAFAETGQLWGNPLYDWGYHEKTGYEWWIRRMEYSLRMYDVVRVDHFRGFEAYYSIPYGDATAEFGHWEKGPGMALFQALEAHFGDELPVIAEDLGFLTPEVYELLEKTGFPGMKVLEFAFDDSEESSYLPHNYTENCVVYTGTHDNDTLAGWFDSMSKKNRSFAREYMGSRRAPKKELHWQFIRLALESPARLAVIPIQDYLGLGTEARINEPSTLGKNWKWRLLPGEVDQTLVEKCRRLAKIYGRLAKNS